MVRLLLHGALQIRRIWRETALPGNRPVELATSAATLLAVIYFGRALILLRMIPIIARATSANLLRSGRVRT